MKNNGLCSLFCVLLGKYLFYSITGIKNIWSSKLKTRTTKIFFISWALLMSFSMTRIYLARHSNFLVDTTIFKYSLMIIILLPSLYIATSLNIPNRLQRKLKRKKVYERMGIRDNFPILINDETNNNLTTYHFYSNGQALDIFKKNTDLLEHSFTEISKSYCQLIKVKKSDDDRRFFEIITANKALIKFYDWSEALISDYVRSNEIFVGISHFGNIIIDFSKMPHLFIAGESGSGKGNISKNILIQLLYKGIYRRVDIFIIDFKSGLDYTPVKGIVKIHKEYNDILKLLQKMVSEMKKREETLEEKSIENIDEYNKIVSRDNQLHRIYIIADEAVDAVSGKDDDPVKDSLTQLARKSRAVGIHLILTTQLPSTKTFGNQLKNNIPMRICGRFADESASRIVIDSTQASKLPEIKGRMLYKLGANIYEVQTPRVNNYLISGFVKKNRDQLKVNTDNKVVNADDKVDLEKKETKFYDLNEIKKDKINIKVKQVFKKSPKKGPKE
jgi:hypothetical protein